MTPNDYVWYACYGSNLSRGRFLRYLEGDAEAVQGAGPGHVGCSDPSPPTGEGVFRTAWSLFFAGYSRRWGGGIAFLAEPVAGEAEPRPRTYCRLYRITRQQFGEVFSQENGWGREVPDLDYARLDCTGSLVLDSTSNYPRLLRLGERGGEPIYSFTCRADGASDPSAPSSSYLAVLVLGLTEAYPEVPEPRVLEYLEAVVGDGWSAPALGKLVRETRRTVTKPTAGGGFLEVVPTYKRRKHRRQFIVQLPPTTRATLSLAHGDPVVLRRAVGDRALSVLAFVNTVHEPEDPGQIAMDQKLRVALGAPTGSLIRVEKAKRTKSLRGRVTRLLERLLGSQPELMRVERATFEDMEVPICRIPEAVFDVIGVGPGSFVRVESTTGALPIRAVKLLESHKSLRRAQREHDPERYPDAFAELNLSAVRGAVPHSDLPSVYLDLDARQKLEVEPLDVVRIVRDVRHLVVSRIYLLLLPTLLAALQVASINLPFYGRALIVGAVVLVSAAAVVFELRNKIA